MRAAVMRCDRIVVEDVPTPTPGAGDVVVKVRACGICGSDLHFSKHMHHIIDILYDRSQPEEMTKAHRCYDELLERYPEQFVAADPDSGEVILAESSLAVLVDRLRERSLDPRTDVAIEFITAQRRNLLV